MARVFVAGGSGVIGTALTSALLERGDTVIGLARSEAAAAKLAALGADVHRGDILDEEVLVEGMRGCELAFNVAGVNSFCVVDPRPMMRVNVDGAVAVLRAAHRAGVGRLVHTSSASAVGEAEGIVADEWTEHRGWYLSSYERSKTHGERAVLACARELGQDVVCVNPASVQGPGRATGTARFLLAFLDGRLKVFVDGWLSLVDIRDCVAGHLLAARRGLAGERYLLSGIGMPIPAVLELGASIAAVDRTPHLLPRTLARAGGAVAEYAYRLRGRRPPVCRELVRELLHGHRYDGSRAERELGLVYTPAAETLRRTVQWARGEGLLRGR